MDFEKRIQDLFVELPEPPLLAPGVVHTCLVGKLLFLGNQFPHASGKISFKGRLGIEVTLDQGRLASRHALLCALGVVREFLGSLNKVERIVQMTGFVASGADFKDHDRVLDSASQLLQDIFGKAGLHSRVAVGVNQLPQNACVALSLIVAVK